MNNKLTILFLTFLGLLSTEIKAQCTYQSKIQEFQNKANSVGTKKASNGSDGYRQYANYYTNLCYCEQSWSDADLDQLVTTVNASVKIINSPDFKYYSLAGKLPQMTKAKCKGMAKGGNNASAKSSNKSSFQIEMENRFNNYNKAMSLKTQGENIAKAFAAQVKQFGNLNKASNPQELLNNFNQNMSQIALLQAQNRVDNLNQIDATLGSALNDLNNGNGEGALFSTLSLIDQSYEQKQAKKEAEYQKQKLVQQHKQQMSQFYWKAVDLNNNAINSYYKSAAYAFSSQDEQYYLDFVAHHECFKTYMKNNFSFSNTNWTINNCEVPKKTQTIENNLTAKEVQYKNTASRKYQLYEKTGVDEFKQAAIRFSGMAADEKPSTENYYRLGHYAGIEEPITAFIAFSTVKELDSKYFESNKQEEYLLIQRAIESTFKDAIIDNNLDFIKSAIGADLHKIVLIESNSAIVYAIKEDKPDVVQLFLNDLTKGITQQQITTKVSEVILMASTLDAPKTIQRFIDLGFSIDFKIYDKSPIDVAVESVSLNSIRVLLNNSNKRESYLNLIKTQNPDILTYFKLIDNHDFSTFNTIKSKDIKSHIISDLYYQTDKTYFFKLLEINPDAIDITKKDIGTQNLKIDFYT
uniref:hypothetical protein n=1 Tax=Mesoflavibacter zeaxanthinifaciens TaxID=393060 RepID=UPI003A94BE1A